MTPTPVLSSTVSTRHIKLMFWGATGTRKTETILRHFPHVLLIDIEGNGEQCVGMAEIPPFLYLKTKDVNEVIDTIDQVAAGKLKFPDGSAVETLAIDSVTVLWSVRQEVGSLAAEQRAAKWGKSADSANMTQLDWVLSKRPLKRLNTKINNSPIKFIVFTAREKDLYVQKEGGKKDEQVKTGVVWDAVKGTEYEMNAIWHFAFDAAGKWSATVDKAQGGLGAKWPKGKSLAKFPATEIFAYAAGLTGEAGTEKDEVETAAASLKKEAVEEKPKPQAPATKAADAEPPVHTKAEFIEKAVQMGYHTVDGKPDAVAIKGVLEAAKLYPYAPEKHAECLKALMDGDRTIEDPKIPF